MKNQCAMYNTDTPAPVILEQGSAVYGGYLCTAERVQVGPICAKMMTTSEPGCWLQSPEQKVVSPCQRFSWPAFSGTQFHHL